MDSSQQRLDERFKVLEEMTQQGQDLIELLKAADRTTLPDLKKKVFEINRALRAEIDEYKRIESELTVSLPDNQRLIKDEHAAYVDLYFPPGSKRRPKFEQSPDSFAQTYLAPVVITGTHIESLKICGTHFADLSDISPVARLKFLKFLELAGRETGLSTALTNHPSIEELKLITLDKPDLACLSTMPKLSKLQVFASSGTPEMLEHIFSATKLEELNLSNNFVDSLDGIATLRKLKVLQVWNNNIPSIAELPSLPNLEVLSIQSNPIQDLSPLLQCKKLKKVTMNVDSGGSGLSKFLGRQKSYNLIIAKKLRQRNVNVTVENQT